jgi:rod shape-determining protein MreB
MLKQYIKRLLSRDLAIDLGTANTLIYARGQGIVLNEPSVIAVDRFNGDIVAVGREAASILGREPRDVIVHRPIEHGVVADYDLAELMLRVFLRRVPRWGRLQAIIGMPSSATHVERRGLIEAATHAGASRVALVEEGVAAAIGADVLFYDSRARLVVDIGGGTTNISIVSSAGVIASHSISVAGLAMNRAIREHVRREHNLLIGEQSAEAIKIKLGAVMPMSEDQTCPVMGKSTLDNTPREIHVHADEIADALEKAIQTIIESVRLVISDLSPEISADLLETGIILTGGGSLLREMDTRFREEFLLPVMRAERPLEAVVLGAGYLLDHPSLLERFQVNDRIPAWQFESALDYTLEAQEADVY